MNNVKFRGLGWIEVSPNNFKEDFIYGGYYKHDEICDYIVVNDFEFKSFKSGTLGQFTGLQDKNGVDIYEGDIMNGKSKVFGVIVGAVVFSEYLDGECYAHELHLGWNVNSIPLKDLVSDGFEVIGNIYENPELLNPVKNG